ncbi:hypothetical protein JCM14076_09850 [Methylosoma difficile]
MLNKIIILMIAATLVGCAEMTNPSISASTESLLVQPVACCERVPSDIAALQEAKPTTLNRVGLVFKSISPPGIVAGLLLSDYGNRWDIISGDLGDKIDARIVELQKTCPAAKATADQASTP